MKTILLLKTLPIPNSHITLNIVTLFKHVKSCNKISTYNCHDHGKGDRNSDIDGEMDVYDDHHHWDHHHHHCHHHLHWLVVWVSQQPVYRQELSGGSDEWWRPGPDQSALGRLSICQFFWVCQIFGIVKYLVRVNIHEKSINGNSASENLDFVLLSRCSSGGNSLWGIHPLHPLHFFCSKAHIN